MCKGKRCVAFSMAARGERVVLSVWLHPPSFFPFVLTFSPLQVSYSRLKSGETTRNDNRQKKK
jgi:hypothetical protein